MKKQILFLLIISSPLFVKAQLPYIPFPTDSAQWSVRYTNNAPFFQTSMQYKMKGDTMLNGLVYHKIYSSLDLYYGSTNQSLHCFLREDTTKKVFVKYPHSSGVDTSEFMLYNFNLSIGDTVTIKLLYHFSTDSLYKFVVTSVDSNLFTDGYRRHFYMYGISPTWGMTCDVMSWAEGIGEYYGLFYNEIQEGICNAQQGYNLECFWDKGTYIFGGTFCDYTTVSTNEINETNSINLYPNPLTDMSEINTKKEFMRMEIYNLLGGKVKTESILGKEKILLNSKDFHRGNYFYKLTKQDETYQIGKFIIQ